MMFLKVAGSILFAFILRTGAIALCLIMFLFWRDVIIKPLIERLK